MDKNIIHQDVFLVSGIMCFDGCGKTIQNELQNCLNEWIEQEKLPKDTQLFIDSEPTDVGIHKITLLLFSAFELNSDLQNKLKSTLRESIPFDLLDIADTVPDSTTNPFGTLFSNKTNIIINTISMCIILAAYLIFPPSFLLGFILTSLSCLSTLFTARHYLKAFIKDLTKYPLYKLFHDVKIFTSMSATVSLGCLLSLGHTVFHVISAITAPHIHHASIILIDYVMPILLMTCINSMDELKAMMLNKNNQFQLKNIKTLFPQMADQYFEEQSQQWIKTNTIQKNMILKIGTGECFPVDSILLSEQAIIDSSHITGESIQNTSHQQNICGGSVNIGDPVQVKTTQNTYNSTVNRLLFKANKALSHPTKLNKASSDNYSGFHYFGFNNSWDYYYVLLIAAGFIAAILAPIMFHIMNVSLIMQNMASVLFSICPCTISIAHQLPKLISHYHRSENNIHWRDQVRGESTDLPMIKTIIFDKTGTLTNGHSSVHSTNMPISNYPELWHKIYLLEKYAGNKHPIAVAIMNYYENAHLKKHNTELNITNINKDAKNRGLSANIQGKTIHIGNAKYFQSQNIIIPASIQHKLSEQAELSPTINQGLSEIYIAEEFIFKGTIQIQHQPRTKVISALQKLTSQQSKSNRLPINLIMLTGDTRSSAYGFNQNIGKIFKPENIYAEQTPEKKEQFITSYIKYSEINPHQIWFIGDGLNDAPTAKTLSELGGISCSINASDKSVFFTDLILNGDIDYLFKHHKINHFTQQCVLQNQGTMIISALALILSIFISSSAGIAVPALLPMGIMVTSTFIILLNSYRTKLMIDTYLQPCTSWVKKLLASDLSYIALSMSVLLCFMTLITGISLFSLIALPAMITLTTLVCINIYQEITKNMLNNKILTLPTEPTVLPMSEPIKISNAVNQFRSPVYKNTLLSKIVSDSNLISKIT